MEWRGLISHELTLSLVRAVEMSFASVESATATRWLAGSVAATRHREREAGERRGLFPRCPLFARALPGVLQFSSSGRSSESSSGWLSLQPAATASERASEAGWDGQPADERHTSDRGDRDRHSDTIDPRACQLTPHWSRRPRVRASSAGEGSRCTVRARAGTRCWCTTGGGRMMLDSEGRGSTTLTLSRRL
jgi:hypothetical protein